MDKTIWVAVPERRAKKDERTAVEHRICPLCGEGELARIAERAIVPVKHDYYPWVGFGFRCTKCNSMFVEGSK